LVDFVTRQCWQTDQSVMAHRFRLVERFDVTSRLNAIRVPTLIMSGERDLLVSKSSLKALREGIEHCRQVSLGNAGHLAFVTNPDTVACQARRFLQACSTELELS